MPAQPPPKKPEGEGAKPNLFTQGSTGGPGLFQPTPSAPAGSGLFTNNTSAGGNMFGTPPPTQATTF